jgi:hypothetical protein
VRKELPARLGFWSSVVVTVLGLVYMVVLVGHFATVGFTNPESLFVQTVGGLVTILTIIRLSSPAEQSSDLARFLPYSTGSVMYALEFLGWGFFLSIACLFVAPIFSGSRLHRVIRWLFTLFALFSIMGLLGFATATPLSAAAFVAWGPINLALSLSLLSFFRKTEPFSVEEDRLDA